jgi:hypothetical protein
LEQGEHRKAVAVARELLALNFPPEQCVFHAMTAGDFRSRRRNVSGQGGG